MNGLCFDSFVESSSHVIFNKLRSGLQKLNHTDFEFRYIPMKLVVSEFDVRSNSVVMHMNHANSSIVELYRFSVNQTTFPGKYLNLTMHATEIENAGMVCEFGGLFIIDGDLGHRSKMGPLCGQILDELWKGRLSFTTHGAVLHVFLYSFHSISKWMGRLEVSQTTCQTFTNVCSGAPKHKREIYDAGIVLEMISSFSPSPTNYVADMILHGQQDTCVRLQFYPNDPVLGNGIVCSLGIFADSSLIQSSIKFSKQIDDSNCYYNGEHMEKVIRTRGSDKGWAFYTSEHQVYYRSINFMEYICYPFGFMVSILYQFVTVPPELYCDHKLVHAPVASRRIFHMAGKCVILSFLSDEYEETRSFRLDVFPRNQISELHFHVSENCGNKSVSSGHWHIEVCVAYLGGGTGSEQGIGGYLYCYQARLERSERLLWYLVGVYASLTVTSVKGEFRACPISALFMDHGTITKMMSYNMESTHNTTRGPCPNNWLNLYQEQCYRALPRAVLSWTSVQEACHKEGGYLISFNSHEEWMHILFGGINHLVFQSSSGVEDGMQEEFSFYSATHRPPLLMIGLRQYVSYFVYTYIMICCW